MTVLLPNARLRLARSVAGTLDAHGTRTAAGWAAPVGPWPGRKREVNAAGEGPEWQLALDPRAWPVAAGDAVLDVDTGQVWLIDSADLITNNAAPDVDWIRARAYRRTTVAGTPFPGTLEGTATEPGGPRFGA